MNIMIINHYAGSDKYGMEFRPYYLGRELVLLGHDVTVIAADCSHLRKKNPVIEKSFTEEYTDGVRYVFVKTPKYKKNDAKRFLNMISFLNQLKMNSKMLYKKYLPDVIVASSTYPYDVKVAKNIASHNQDVRVCYEIHDIWPLSLIELYKISPKNPYMKSLQKAEIYAYENADLIISILPNVDRHIEELGFYDTNFVHIPNGVVVSEESDQTATKEVLDEIERIKKNDKFIVMYLGGFSKANALDDFIGSAKHLDEKIQLVMVGGGPLWEEINQKINNENIKNISVLGAVPKNTVKKTLELADALYIGAKRCHLYQYGVGMNKIFDYMLASRPIIYGIEASNDIVQDAHCGITVEPENPAAIAAAIHQMAAMSPLSLSAMGQSGYEYVLQNHDYKKLSKRFLYSISEHRGDEC